MEDFNANAVMKATGMHKNANGVRAKITTKKLNDARKLLVDTLDKWVDTITTSTEYATFSGLSQGPNMVDDSNINSDTVASSNSVPLPNSESFQNKLNAVVDLWLSWVSLEKDAKQWKQASEVFDKACSCPIGQASSAIWIAYGKHLESRSKPELAVKQYTKGCSTVTNKQELMKVMSAFFQLKQKMVQSLQNSNGSSSTYSIEDFLSSKELNSLNDIDKEMFSDHVKPDFEVIGVKTIDDQIQGKLQAAEQQGVIVSVTEGSTPRDETNNTNSIVAANTTAQTPSTLSSVERVETDAGETVNDERKLAEKILKRKHDDSLLEQAENDDNTGTSFNEIDHDVKREKLESPSNKQDFMVKIEPGLEAEEEYHHVDGGGGGGDNQSSLAQAASIDVKQEEEVEQEEQEEDEFNGLVKLIFPLTPNSVMSKHAVYIADVDGCAGKDGDYLSQVVSGNYKQGSQGFEFVVTAVKAMYMVQVLKERTLDNCHHSKETQQRHGSSIKQQLKDMVATQRTCLAAVGLESFEEAGMTRKGSLLKNAGVVKALLMAHENKDAPVRHIDPVTFNDHHMENNTSQYQAMDGGYQDNQTSQQSEQHQFLSSGGVGMPYQQADTEVAINKDDKISSVLSALKAAKAKAKGGVN